MERDHEEDGEDDDAEVPPPVSASSVSIAAEDPFQHDLQTVA